MDNKLKEILLKHNVNINSGILDEINSLISSKVDIHKKSKERYKRLVQNTSEITYIYSLKKGALFWSHRVKDILGFDPQNLIEDSKKWTNAIHEEDRNHVNKFLNSIEVGQKYKLRYRIYDTKKQLHWFYDQIVNVYEIDGDKILEGIISDITYLKKAEQFLKEESEKLAAITGSAQDAIILIDDKGEVTFWNNSAEKMFQYKEHEILGQQLHYIVAPKELHKDYFKGFKEFIKTGKGKAVNKTVELIALRKDGNQFPVELSLSALELGSKWHAVGLVRDISDRKSKEKQLKESEERFKLLSELTYEGIVIHENGIAIDCNQSFLKILGYKKSEIIGNNMLSIIHKDYHELVKQNIPKEKSPPYEILGIKKDKTLVPIELEAKTIILKDNKVKVVAVRDITERRKALQQIRDSEKRYQQLFDFSPNSSVIMSLSGFVKNCSNKFTDYTGLSKEEVIGKHFTKLPLFSFKQLPEFIKIFKNLAISKKSSTYDYSWLHKNGKRYSGRVYIEPIFRDNKITELLAITVDLTDSKIAEKALIESEKRFRTYIESSPLSIYMVNKKGEFTFINSATSQLLGYSTEELINQPVSLINFEEDIPLLKEKYDATKLYEKVPSYEIRLRKKNGEILFVIVDSVKIMEDEVIHFATDITEMKKFQQQISIKNNELNELNITKDKFFSIIAHDLRGPMYNVLGFSDLLAENVLTYDKERLSYFVSLLNNSAKQTSSLLENLLVWSRSQRNVTIFEPQIYSCIDLTNEVLKEAQHLMLPKNISLKQNIEKALNVFTDKEMFKTIFRNLISNAIKYSHNGGEIIIGYQESNNNQIKFFVKDNGVGMSKDISKELFKIDQNVTTEGTNHERGTGLGLIICKDFVEKHQGIIWAESEKNKGSIFYFTMPATDFTKNTSD